VRETSLIESHRQQTDGRACGSASADVHFQEFAPIPTLQARSAAEDEVA